MRIVLALVVVAITAVVGVWVFTARRAKARTPSIDAVLSWLDAGATRTDGEARGTLRGYALRFSNKQYRDAMWTELSITVPKAAPTFLYKADAIGDPLAFKGEPTSEAMLLVKDLHDLIAKAHPRSIEVRSDGIQLIADRVVSDGEDARVFVQLGVSLAARASNAASFDVPAAPANTRVSPTEPAARNVPLRIAIAIAIVVVFVAVGVWFVRDQIARRNSASSSE